MEVIELHEVAAGPAVGSSAGARNSSSAPEAAAAPRPSASGTITDRKYSIAAWRPALPAPSPASIARLSLSISHPAVSTAVIVISA